MATSTMRSMASDYANLRTIPAMLSTVFLITSAYGFGAIDPLVVNWLGGYTLTTEHAILGSVATMLVAFASSATRDFQMYDDWEKMAIAVGPVVILGNEYVTEISDLLLDLGDPLGMQVAFIASAASWMVAVR